MGHRSGSGPPQGDGNGHGRSCLQRIMKVHSESLYGELAKDVIDVSVIIVSWNTRELLLKCVASIYESTSNISIEIIVVDNSSADGSVDAIRGCHPNIRVIANGSNVGFAAANNRGIHVARGAYLLLLNPDTIVLPGVIHNCFNYARAHPDVAAIGCQVLESENRIQRTGFSFPTPWNLFLVESGLSKAFPKSNVFGKPELGWWDRNSEMDVDVVSGMFMFIPMQALKQVGPMDEDYFVYAEEADLCFRLRKAGWRCVFAPIGQIIHLEGGGKSTKQVNIRMYVQLQKSLAIFQRKNLGWGAWLSVKLIYVLSNLLRCIYWFLKSLWVGDTKARQKSVAAIAALRFHIFGTEPN